MAKKLRSAAALLASQRKRGPRACTVCGKEFIATSRARYCSTSCKLKAYRERRRNDPFAELERDTKSEQREKYPY
jgi:predicted nucleic acid-binding Zn ribbon protein